jgi:membrane protein implicated in regulation of membrane protease activity
MDRLLKYSQDEWIFGIVSSLIAAAIFAVIIIALRWLWRWLRNLSPEYRRADQTTRIIKIFVHRSYMQKKDVYSLTRGQFFLISRFLINFTTGIICIAMGAFFSWITNMGIGFYLFLGLSIWIFFAAVSWLDSRWSQKTIENLDEQALSDAAAILGETTEELRIHVTHVNT